MAREFFQKSWIFFLAAGVIALSAVLLQMSTDMIQKSGVQSRPQKTADVERVGTLASPIAVPGQQDEEDDMEVSYLLALDESAQTMIQAKDIKAETAAEIGARISKEFFDADVNGEICHVRYIPASGVDMSNRWDAWSIEFGDRIPGTYVYTVLMNSVSGEIVNVYKSYTENGEEPEAVDLEESEKEAFIEDCLCQAEAYANDYFFQGAGIDKIIWDGLQEINNDIDTGRLIVLSNSDDGKALRLGFSKRYGLVSIEHIPFEEPVESLGDVYDTLVEEAYYVPNTEPDQQQVVEPALVVGENLPTTAPEPEPAPEETVSPEPEETEVPLPVEIPDGEGDVPVLPTEQPESEATESTGA